MIWLWHLRDQTVIHWTALLRLTFRWHCWCLYLFGSIRTFFFFLLKSLTTNCDFPPITLHRNTYKIVFSAVVWWKGVCLEQLKMSLFLIHLQHLYQTCKKITPQIEYIQKIGDKSFNITGKDCLQWI